MYEAPTIIINSDGIIKTINDMVCAITGIPGSTILNKPLTELLAPEFQHRLELELNAFKKGEQTHGRLNAAIVGIDSSIRRLSLGISQHENNDLIVEIGPDGSSGGHIYFTSSSISDSQKLLPVARRIAAICRRSESKQELLSKTMAILTEVTDAICAAAIEWGGAVSDWPIAATAGNFDEQFLKGIFRSSVIGRLSRGDVIVKDAFEDATVSNYSLVLVPLMASETPEAIVILYINESTVMSPREQQTLGLLGEIIGLGMKSILSIEEPTEDYRSRPADNEATIALGRLSAGLAHEINNAVTVLRNNTERIAADAKRFGQHLSNEELIKDSIHAVQIIADLTGALKAFAPEETRDSSTIDLTRIIDMVISSVRFYAKRGVDLSVAMPKNEQLMVICRSHYLIKSLFLIFVELTEAAFASSKLLNISIEVSRKERKIICNISVSSANFNIPTILLSQIQKDGVLARLVLRAGALLKYNIEGNNLSLEIVLIADETTILKKSSQTTIIPPPVPDNVTSRGTILIVDDDPAIVRSTRRILEKQYDILASTSAKEALQIINSGRKIDVILLDIFMPETNGLEMAKMLKKQNASIEKNIIFITGGSADRETMQYVAESNIAIFEKPINLNNLKEKIDNIISGYNQ